MSADFTTLCCTRSKNDNSVTDYCAIRVIYNDFKKLDLYVTCVDDYDFTKAKFNHNFSKKNSFLTKSLKHINSMLRDTDLLVLGDIERDYRGYKRLVTKYCPDEKEFKIRRDIAVLNVNKEISSGVSLRSTTKDFISKTMAKNLACDIADAESYDDLSASAIKCAYYTLMVLQILEYDLNDFCENIMKIMENDGESIVVSGEVRPERS